ncbi:hypothetical protein [Streptomyces sp. NBC_01408]|uniref:hypothetical protein n=1 Tax=Streptomyces sp. NBC_01408 TaxID=2903855 RepID=UPI002254F89F|nr:hypothetical protein [Streptomyces sp. NBC_01408]MCX4691942.1 hypothetical protein [Streptomyces sp. NBC_01408]
MTETQNDTPALDAPTEPMAPAPEAASAPEGRRRKAALVAGSVAAVTALVAGGVGGFFVLKGADRSAPPAYWVAAGQSAEKGEEPAPVPPNAITGKLLPLPEGYALGPDIGAEGNDHFLSGDKMAETLARESGGVGGADRRSRDAAWAELKLKGTAGRSYTRGKGAPVFEVHIMQAAPEAVGSFSAFSKAVLEAGGDDRPAPKVDGYPDAKCVLSAVGDEKDQKRAKIDVLQCVAVEGDVMVDFRAFGPRPLPTSDVIGFFKNQLSHLKTPGESA